MTALTTRQRDMLNIIIGADDPIRVEDLAEDLGLSPREVNYGLTGVKQWLSSNDIELQITPGVGIQLTCSEQEARTLLQELSSLDYFQLILKEFKRRNFIGGH